MSANSFHRVAVVALAAALMLGGAPIAHAQQGIKVHGDWTLTVRNPDGTVVARYEFKNSLSVMFGADKLMAQILAGAVTPGYWTVTLTGNPPTICNANNAPCRIAETGAPSIANSENLTVEIPTSGPLANKVVLTGSLKIASAGAIVRVGTVLSACANTVAPASCNDQNQNDLTEKILASPVPVVANQTVDVVVVISFS